MLGRCSFWPYLVLLPWLGATVDGAWWPRAGPSVLVGWGRTRVHRALAGVSARLELARSGTGGRAEPGASVEHLVGRPV